MEMGAYNQTISLGIIRPLHAPGPMSVLCIVTIRSKAD